MAAYRMGACSHASSSGSKRPYRGFVPANRLVHAFSRLCPFRDAERPGMHSHAGAWERLKSSMVPTVSVGTSPRTLLRSVTRNIVSLDYLCPVRHDFPGILVDCLRRILPLHSVKQIPQYLRVKILSCVTSVTDYLVIHCKSLMPFFNFVCHWGKRQVYGITDNRRWQRPSRRGS